MSAGRAEHVDILVLGSGEGGKYLAWYMARSGHRTAVVERRWIGGSCPNINCLPSKNEIWSAKVAALVKHAAEFGTQAGSAAIDMARVRQRKRDMVDGLIAMHLERYKASGAELIMGTGRFVVPKTLEVRLNEGGTRVLVGDRVFLDVGTHATIPDIPELAAEGQQTEPAPDFVAQGHERLGRFRLEIDHALPELADVGEDEIERSHVGCQPLQLINDLLGQVGRRKERVHERHVRWDARRGTRVMVHSESPDRMPGGPRRYENEALERWCYGRLELRTCSISRLTCCRSMNSR